jgi:hypothetical protein
LERDLPSPVLFLSTIQKDLREREDEVKTMMYKSGTHTFLDEVYDVVLFETKLISISCIIVVQCLDLREGWRGLGGWWGPLVLTARKES